MNDDNYLGKPIDLMTREELIKGLKSMIELYQMSLENGVKQSELLLHTLHTDEKILARQKALFLARNASAYKV